MSDSVLFIQFQGDKQLIEVSVPENPSERNLHRRLTELGILTAPDMLVFIDEAEEHLQRDADRTISGIRHGTRVHISRCRKVRVSVHYLNLTVERDFAPGVRVRSVKTWAVEEFRLDHKDAAEHVLQICEAADRPATDTPLHVLVHGGCSLCFDLVPEKRIEGCL